MGWTWDQSLPGYRDGDTGRKLPPETVRKWTADYISKSQNKMTDLAGLVSDNTLSVADWETQFKTAIKNQYIDQYIAGVGGRDRMTQADWGSIGGMLNNQYHPYLDDFRREITMGNLSEAQIKARMDLYLSSSKQAYEKANGRAAKKAGMTEERWVLGAVGSEHCEDCLGLANAGWVTAPEISKDNVPGDGRTICGVNCACRIEHRQGEQ
jgi:hypothetical protein